jgi:hypothetical protein
LERRRMHAEWQSHGMPLTGYARIGGSEVMVRVRVPAPIQKGGRKGPLFLNWKDIGFTRSSKVTVCH